MALQTIISRQVDLTKEAAVVTVATFHAGVRNNIIPEDAELTGTIRTLDTGMQRIIHQKIRLIVANIAESMGAEAETEIIMGYPVTYNDPALTDLMLPTIKRVTGEKYSPDQGSHRCRGFFQICAKSAWLVSICRWYAGG